MHPQKIVMLVILIILVGVFDSNWATPLSTSGSERGLPLLQPLSPSSSPSQTSSDQEAIHKRCLEAEERLQEDIAAMVPGRSWTWQSDAERSRKHLHGLQRNVTALRDCEDEFEAYLTAEQRFKVRTELKLVQRLWQRLEGNVQSLDLELQKRYPARWHVAQDVSDMQKEIRKWSKLHEHITTEVGANRQE